jgi:toxin CptA
MNRVDLQASRQLAGLLSAVHLLAGVGVWQLPLTPVWLWGLLLVLAANLIAYLSRWHAGPVLKALVWKQDGRLQVMTQAEDSWVDATLQEAAYVSPWLTVLPLRIGDTGRSLRLVLLPDMLDGEDYRRLRVHLRWAVKPG